MSNDKLAFLTGSRKYGQPRVDSDVDLVIRIQEWELDALVNALGKKIVKEDYGDSRAVSLKVGNLNLICCVTDGQYAGWKEATEICTRLAPLNREAAVHIFRKVVDSELNESVKDRPTGSKQILEDWF